MLKIAKSSYYYRIKHPKKERYTKDACDTVYRIFVLHNGSFGRRIIKKELAKEKINYSERKISAILKQMGLHSKYGRKKLKNVYTSKNTTKYIHENIYMKLSKEEKTKYEIWSMDFTEEVIDKKRIYICGIISVNSKILVAATIGEKCTAELAEKALQNAINIYGAPYMIMTDRGAAFTSKAFYDILQKHNIQHSMSRPHTPIDNCFIETFWKSMKTEIGKTNRLNENDYRMIIDYYVFYYNNIRPHSSLNYETPIQHRLNNLSFII